jgi:cytochrome bd ubiquinol oxidase subunit I
VLGLIATRSVDEPIIGLKDFLVQNEQRIRNGMIAYALLQKLRNGEDDAETRARFKAYQKNLGYGLLLKKYTPNVIDATEEQITMAARDTIPNVAPLFWTFRVMVACGFIMLFVFAASFYVCSTGTVMKHRWLLRLALYCLPLPWIASEMGWIVAEYGRQPWSIAEILPTFMSASSRSAGELYLSLAGFIGFYTLLLVIELFLMLKYARLGPSSLHSGRYYHEKIGGAV